MYWKKSVLYTAFFQGKQHLVKKCEVNYDARMLHRNYNAI
jgi:hypothetical protein